MQAFTILIRFCVSHPNEASAWRLVPHRCSAFCDSSHCFAPTSSSKKCAAKVSRAKPPTQVGIQGRAHQSRPYRLRMASGNGSYPRRAGHMTSPLPRRMACRPPCAPRSEMAMVGRVLGFRQTAGIPAWLCWRGVVARVGVEACIDASPSTARGCGTCLWIRRSDGHYISR